MTMGWRQKACEITLLGTSMFNLEAYHIHACIPGDVDALEPSYSRDLELSNSSTCDSSNICLDFLFVWGAISD